MLKERGGRIGFAQIHRAILNRMVLLIALQTSGPFSTALAWAALTSTHDMDVVDSCLTSAH